MSSSFLSQEEIDSLLKGTGEDSSIDSLTEIEKDLQEKSVIFLWGQHLQPYINL